MSEPVPFWYALINFLFPPRCPFCGEGGANSPLGVCVSCAGQIPRITHPRCPRCGVGFTTEAGEDHLCSGCLRGEGFFTKARALAHYEGILVEWISRFKYRGASRLARPLGAFLADYKDADLSFSDYDLVMPVPLHRRRLRHRGYNQSLLLARAVARQYGLALDFRALKRIRPTQPQTELTAAERRKNIRGAFAVSSPKTVAGKVILLVDDVFTTGATAEECAKVLLKAGAEQVDVLTLARAR